MKPWRLLFACSVITLGGCRTPDESSYADIVPGNYRDLASCFSRQQLPDEDETADSEQDRNTFTRRIALDDPARRRIEVEVYGYRDVTQAFEYKVIFIGQDEKTTKMIGWPGALSRPYWWPNQVWPQIARCTGRLPL